ncbi:MAG: DUF5675 family protein [Candidatus Saccharicenans sp.]
MGIHHTWVNAFDPVWKFSGQEQDAEPGLYYFGARYYDPTLYRFLSPDPVIPTDVALYAPQRWNLCGYCLGNPLNFVDNCGAEIESSINILILKFYYGTSSTMGFVFVNGEYVGVSLERPANGPSPALSCVPEGLYSVTGVWYGDYGEEKFPIFILNYSVFDDEINNYRISSILAGSNVSSLHNCIYIGDVFKGQSNLLGSNAIRNLDRIYQDALKETSKIMDMASYATQTDMVLYTFDALESLSLAASAAATIKINVLIISVFTLINLMMPIFPCF